MKVFRLVPDVNRYQQFFAEDETQWDWAAQTVDASAKQQTWHAPDVFILHPRLKRGHFFDLCPGALVCDAVAVRALQDLLEMSCELLPLEHEGERLFVMNVLECVNVLDKERTQWVYGKTSGRPIRIEKYCFHAHRFTETPLFKIPETARGEILTVEGMKDPEDEFKYRVEQAGLEGLIFEEVWSDED